jgi:CRISPR-associated protein Cas1
MPTLYVTEPGARIEKEYGRLLVTKEDEVIASVPLVHVTEVVLVGSVGATTPALLSLLDHGCGLTLITATGQLRGRLRPADARNVPLRQAQYRRAGEETFCREISRAIVAGKLRNCRTLARRMVRSGHYVSGDAGEAPAPDEPATAPSDMAVLDPALTHGEPQAEQASPATDATFERLNRALAQVPLAKDTAELRGLEGQGAKAYFSVLRQALWAELSFEKRTRRPPRDPANALLSLAYALLTNAVFTAAEVAGLDPYAGYFHADKYGRPALALDLMEEFRPVVADSVVLWVVNKHMLTPDDFETGEDSGVRLSRRGLKCFLAQFSRRLQTEVYHPAAGRPLSYQKVLEVQARALRQCIESGQPNYRPLAVK